MLAREPKPREREILSRRLAVLRKTFAANEAAAKQLIGVGDSKPDVQVAPAELAAWTSLATVLLNLDETISKE